jgi:hypothetical protein
VKERTTHFWSIKKIKSARLERRVFYFFDTPLLEFGNAPDAVARPGIGEL